MYAWSVSMPRPFPINYFLAFFVVGFVVGGVGVLSFWFPPSLNAPLQLTEEVDAAELTTFSSGSESQDETSGQEESSASEEK